MLIRGGRLFEAGRLLNFHHFQQVKYVYFARKLCPRGSLLLEFIHSSGWGGGERLFEFDWEEEGVGAYSRLGAY